MNFHWGFEPRVFFNRKKKLSVWVLKRIQTLAGILFSKTRWEDSYGCYEDSRKSRGGVSEELEGFGVESGGFGEELGGI